MANVDMRKKLKSFVFRERVGDLESVSIDENSRRDDMFNLDHQRRDSFPTPFFHRAETKKYYYPTTGGDIKLSPDNVVGAGGHHTVLHKPTSSCHHQSPSLLTQPPMGINDHIDWEAKPHMRCGHTEAVRDRKRAKSMGVRDKDFGLD